MRLICFFCGKSVSNELPPDTTLRAVCVCPDCVGRVIREDATSIMSPPEDD
jgi:DNA-directed RNA polymerase subunit RPC12/RpoP